MYAYYLLSTYFLRVFVFNDLHFLTEALIGFILVFIWLSLGFNVMHDASHYAYFRKARANNYVSIIWNSFASWNHTSWFYHHVLYHHSFTSSDKDPDVYHLVPYYRKKATQRQCYFPLCLFPIIVFTIPGLFYDQAFAYFVIGPIFGTVLLSPLKMPRFNYSAVELAILSLRFYTFYLMRLSATLSHMISCNVFYYMNIIGDHDTFEVSVTNHYEGNDWLRLQVQNSGNFKTDSPIHTCVWRY